MITGKLRFSLTHCSLFLIIISIILSACFSPYTGDQRTITINLGGNSRSVSPWPPTDPGNNFLNEIEYKITLTGPGPSQTFPAKGGDTIRATVIAGYWTVSIEAIHNNELYATGENSLTVSAGQNNTVIVTMNCNHVGPVLTAATCTTAGERGPGNCERSGCNGTATGGIIPINPNAHDWGSIWTETTPPTCIAAGIQTQACTKSGCVAVSPTTQPGNPALGHSFTDWRIVTEAGPTTNMSRIQKCAHCPAEQGTVQEIPYTYLGNLPDDFYYSISGTAWRIDRGAEPPNDVFIPAYRNGLPVTEILWHGSFGNMAAFGDRPNITSVTIGNNITSIGNRVFQGSNNISNITIPDSVTSIGMWAFYDNTTSSITSVTFKGASTTFIDSSFPSAVNLRSAYQAGGAGTYIRQGTNWTKQ